jgi:hypothetical protein
MSKLTLEVTFADGREVQISPTLEDTLAFETTLRRNKSWGSLQESALKMQPFRAWNALRRAGLTDLTWEQFTTGETAALNVAVADDPDAEDETDAALEVAGLGKDTPTVQYTP